MTYNPNAGLPQDPVVLAAAGSVVVGSKVIGDTVDRFTVKADGTLTYGNGAATWCHISPYGTGLQFVNDAQGGSVTLGIGQIMVGSGFSGVIPIVGNGINGQTADLAQFQVNTVPKARIDAQGKPAFSEAANGPQGIATLFGGTVTVANTKVTANSRIQLTAQSLGTVTTPKAIAVTARVVGTSFTITSADATDTSVVAYLIMEPA